ncbi:hypothetical protein HYR99_32905 [Candidatus Poribacteria bacterium]|nr:hypothetical protein [Candidatus Poribacteria bacterium]
MKVARTVWRGGKFRKESTYPYKWKTLINPLDGLPMNRVSAFHPDQSGRVWIRTGGDGVSLYDGKDFRQLDHG